MERSCLKCGHVHGAASGDALEECPKCGAIYTRVEALQAGSVPQRRKRRSGRGWLVILGLSVVVAAGWYGLDAKMKADRRALERSEVDRLEAITTRWTDAARVATRTARIALAAQVQRLQDVRDETRALTFQTCMSVPHRALIEHQEASINAMLAFMADDDDGEAASTAAARQSMERFFRDLAECKGEGGQLRDLQQLDAPV